MIKRLLLVGVLVATAAFAQSQVLNKLFGVYEDQSGNYHFMNADAVTAAFSNVGGTLSGFDSHFVTASTIDRNGEYYYIGVDSSSTKKLLKIDLNTGDVVGSTSLSSLVSEGRMELHYHNGSNKLYGLNLLSGNDNAQIVEIDTTTGLLGVIKSIGNVDSKINGSGALDEVGNRFFFNAADEFSDFKMYIVNLTDSTSQSKPYSTALLIPPFEMEYDPINGKLYGLVRTDQGTYYFAEISSNTALVTNLNNLNGVEGLFTGSATIDPVGRRYFFTGFDDQNKKRLYVLNIEDGEIIANPEITADPVLYGVDLEYMFWGVIGQEEHAVQQLQVYPNPADDLVWFNIPFQGQLQVELYDMMGKMVSSETYTTPGLNKVNVSSLPQGIYNIRASNGNKFYAGSIVVK